MHYLTLANSLPERLSHGEQLSVLPQGQRLAGRQPGCMDIACLCRFKKVEPLSRASSRPGHPATGRQDPAGSSQNTSFPREMQHMKISNTRDNASAPGHDLEAKCCLLQEAPSLASPVHLNKALLVALAVATGAAGAQLDFGCPARPGRRPWQHRLAACGPVPAHTTPAWEQRLWDAAVPG